MTAAAKLSFSLAGALGLAVFFGLLLHSCEQRAYQAKLAALQNQLATRDKTDEVQRGLYTKLAESTRSVQSDLDQRDKQVEELRAQLKKQGHNLLSATTAVVKWKSDYESLAEAKQSQLLAAPGRERVDFAHDFGYVRVEGYTLTNPAQAWVKLSQGRPLKLTLAIAEDAAHAWHAYVASSEDNVGVDIAVSAVDPYVLQPKWYEKIELSAAVGASGAPGVIGEAGVGYQIGKFTFGPKIWGAAGVGRPADVWVGFGLSWRPFQKPAQ